MNRTISLTLAIAALLIGSNAIAGSNSNNSDTVNNYGDTNSYNQGGTANAGAAAGAVAGAAALSGSYSHGGDASIGDVTNVAAGGQGGRGGDGGTGIGLGGSAHQGQQQGQGQSQSSVNGQAQSNRSETNTSTQQNQSSSSFNAGNAQNVGGQSTNIKFEDVANAPPVILSNINPTMSCAGGFSLGGSSQDGAGALGFTWTSRDCKTVVAGHNMAAIGQKAAACEIYQSTDGYRRAVKIAKKMGRSINVDCSKSK